MLLRNSISSTRKFFRKTLGNLKSLFSGVHYQKLPKLSPLEKPFLYADHHRSMAEKLEEDRIKSSNETEDSENKTTERKMTAKEEVTVKRKEGRSSANYNFGELSGESRKSLALKMEKKKDEDDNNNNLLEEKLKEIEMLDLSDVDHVLDIEEVLHLYSRLTCPVYLEIVDKFFVETLAEFFKAET